MPMQYTPRSDRRKKFTGSQLKLPQLNTSGPMAVDIEENAYSRLLDDCFEGPLTPLSSEGDHGSFDIDVDQSAYNQRNWLQRICFEGPLTPLSSEGGSFDSLFESGNSMDQTPIQPPLTRAPAMSTLDNINLPPPPALTREGTDETFNDGLLTPRGSRTKMGPQASIFDAVHACEWFPNPPPVPKGEVVVSDFSDLRRTFQFPPSAWQLGPDGHLVQNRDVKFGPSVPISGPLLVSDVVEREMQALMRQREVVMRVLEEEGDMGMRGIDFDVLLSEDRGRADDENSDKEDLQKPKLLGPEGTELYDGLITYPEEWVRQSSSLCSHPTCQEILE